MRRFILGEGSFVESLMGRVLVLVLFTSLVGAVLTLLFLVNHLWMPQLLKYAILVATGLAAGFGARRLLIGRNFLVRFLAAGFALFITLGLLNVLSLGYIGLNLLRAYPNNPQWDGALQFALTSVFAALSLRAWRITVHEVVVEPRYSPPPASIPAPRPARRSVSRSTRRASPVASRRRTTSQRGAPAFGAAFATWTSQLAAQLNGIFTSPSRGATTRSRKTAKRSASANHHRQRLLRRGPAVYLSSKEEHRCPYCLEEVKRNDPRGIKICKVCKTWHHADCWAITGVCQVPHEYVN